MPRLKPKLFLRIQLEKSREFRLRCCWGEKQNIFKDRDRIMKMEEMITIPKKEYERLKLQANVDVELLEQLIGSFKDIKEGRIKRVK